MPYFGDIYIPWITDIDTSISKDITEKNFVDHPPQVYELTPNLEAGTYSAILNETVHDKNESFAEQQDAVLSMVSRHGSEFPFSVSGNDGYVVVNGASTTIDPRQEIRESEIQARFLDGNVYNGAIVVNPYPFVGGDFTSQAGGGGTIIGFPSTINVVGRTADGSMSTEDGTFDLYVISERSILEYEENGLDSQQLAICRAFNSTNDRIYSDSQVIDNGSMVTNGKIRCTYDSLFQTVDYYDGSTWNEIGEVNIGFDAGYTSKNTNEEIQLEFVNHKQSSIYRGLSAVGFTFDDESIFAFATQNSISFVEDGGFFGHWEDGNGNDIILVRDSSDGEFYTDPGYLGITNLNPEEEYQVFVSVVPDAFASTPSLYADKIYNLGSRNKTFVQ